MGQGASFRRCYGYKSPGHSECLCIVLAVQGARCFKAGASQPCVTDAKGSIQTINNTHFFFFSLDLLTLQLAISSSRHHGAQRNASNRLFLSDQQTKTQRLFAQYYKRQIKEANPSQKEQKPANVWQFDTTNCCGGAPAPSSGTGERREDLKISNTSKRLKKLKVLTLEMWLTISWVFPVILSFRSAV